METSEKEMKVQGMAQARSDPDESRMSLLASLVGSCEDAIIGKTPQGLITVWNPAAESMFGYRAEEIVGKPISILLSADRSDEMDEILEKIRLGERVGHFETVLRRRDGSFIEVSLTVSPVRDSTGRLIGVSSIARDITRRKLEEESLRLSESRYRALYHDNPTMVVTIDTGLTMLAVNPMCACQLGYTIAELEGQSVLKLFLEEDRPALTEQLRICFQNPNQVYRWQFRKIHKDGGLLWVEETAQAVYDVSGALNVLVVCQDVTERKRVEEALRESEKRFQAIFNLAAVGIAQVSLTGQWLLINQKLCDILGYSHDQLKKLTVLQISHPDDIRVHRAHIRRLLAGEIATYPMRYIHKGGSIVWVNLSVTLVRDGSGEPGYFIAVLEDINDRKRAEEALRESEEKFYKVFNLAPIGITISTLSERRFIEINEAGERLSGYRRNEVIGHQESVYSIWKDPAERDQVIGEILDTGEVRDREMPMKDRSGRVFWGLFSAVVIEIRGEKHLLSLVSDIGERKKAQEALRESEERFRLLANTAPVMIWEAGPDARCTFFNRPWLEFTGRNLEQELGDGWIKGVHPDDLERCVETYRSAVKDRSRFFMEYRLRRGDGEYGWIADTGVPRLSPDGELLGYIGTCFDITERKRMKEELQQANDLLVQRVAERTAELSETIERLKVEINERIRMGQALQAETTERLNVQAELRGKELLLLQQSRLAAMGEMIGNIAHQWRQPLNLLGLLAQDLSMTYRKGEFSTEYLEANVQKVLETISHMSKTIDDFRYFFRPFKEKVDFRILEVIEKTISLLEGSLNAQQIRTAIVPACDPVVKGNPNEFSQVLLNIMINARDALVTQKVTSPAITIEIGREEGRCVVTITDNAGGIPEEIIDKIFDPYFTTKGPDKGTGVGLYMSKMIIEKNMGGSLSARNVGKGAQFRIVV